MGRKAKNPTNFDWTPEREEKLLMFWEENAFLYNLELKDYSKVDKKQRLYEQFAAEMGTTVEEIQRRMATFRTMRSQVRKKEEENKSGSSPVKLTKRQQFVKSRLAFLERHVKTRKSVSTLPELPMSQTTDSVLFSQESNQPLIDREEMERFMGPAAIDGFLGAGNEIGDATSEQDEQEGRFTIPTELLFQMPIAHVTESTRIIPVTKPVTGTSVVITPCEEFEPLPGPSGMQAEANAMVVEVQDHVTALPEQNNITPAFNTNLTQADNNLSQTRKNLSNEPPVGPTPKRAAPTSNPENSQGNMVSVPTVPKKGYNVKNKKKVPNEVEMSEKDDNVQRRLQVLGEIADIVKKSGEKRNMTELDVWGQYIGLKVARVVEGCRRDKVLVKVENLINDAIHGEVDMEE